MSASNASLLTAGVGAVIARRYARALFALASDRKMVDVVADEMRKLREALLDEATHDIIRHHACLPSDMQAKLMEEFAAAIKCSDVTRRFLVLMGLHHRLRYLGATVEMFLQILAEKAGEYTVNILSAKPLDEAGEQKIETSLAKTLGGKVYLRTALDPSLIGGLVVRVGSRQIDASVKGKLAALERQLKSQQEAA